MPGRFLTLWILMVSLGVAGLTATAFAQKGKSNPPTATGGYPPWASSAPASEPTAAAPAGGATGGDSFFVPVQPPTSEGFDYFDDEEESGDGGGRSGGGSGREGKGSFRLLKESSADRCKKWGNSLLSGESYTDKTSCEMALDKKVDAGKLSIEELTDKIERFKLKKVIRGELGNRNEAKKYDVSFLSLQKALDDAAQSGCSCLR
ncbi:MAG: hypothetical protein V1495_03480 [Pseudomonadota bacterium]